MDNYSITGALYADGRFVLDVDASKITDAELVQLAREACLDADCKSKEYFARKLRKTALSAAQRALARSAFSAALG